MDHNAISIAPVSEAGTIPTRQSAGTPKIARDRVITSFNRAFGAAALWLRPSKAPSSAAKENPGRFAQGPDEKLGFWGRTTGAGGAEKSAIKLSLTEEKRPIGGA